MYYTMLLPFVLTFVGTGLGFAQCGQSPGEGSPLSSPPGRLAGRRGEQREKVGEGRVSVGGVGWKWGMVGREVRQMALGVGPSPDRMVSSFPWCPGLYQPDPCLIFPGEKKFPLREKVSPSQSSGIYFFFQSSFFFYKGRG